MKNSYNPNSKIFRTIVLSGEINESSVKDAIQTISFINEIDSGKDEVEPIKLIINSLGGNILDGFALIGVIENSFVPVYTYGYGSIMSMALPILVAGDKRFGHPLATFMYHECLDSVPYDKMSIIKENIEETDRLMDMYDEYLTSRTSLTQKQLNKVKNKKTDWYFGSDEALSYNIINEVI
jgi:ATP-dependent protease ClpP protease subunit